MQWVLPHHAQAVQDAPHRVGRHSLFCMDRVADGKLHLAQIYKALTASK
jgi:hypothetical protein